jgi:hypothetical protein
MTQHLTALVVKIQQIVRKHLAKKELYWLRIQKIDELYYETDQRLDAEEWVEMHRFDHIHDD